MCVCVLVHLCACVCVRVCMCVQAYLGELMGMVGSIETRDPSESTIMMAVFLNTTHTHTHTHTH